MRNSHVDETKNIQTQLWFTSSVSHSMMTDGSATFSGLYKCSLNAKSGRCEGNAQVVVDALSQNGGIHRGIKLLNVVLDTQKEHVYARAYDEKGQTWEIVKTALQGSMAEFQPFFKTHEKYSWNDCGFKCCGNTGKAYVLASPKTFLMDDNDIYIAWDGFYQDCEDMYLSKMLWTVGINKLRKDDPNCVLNAGNVYGNDGMADFASCTEPIAIVYQNKTGRSRVVSYGGFSMSKAPNDNRRIFFLSMLKSQGIDQGEFHNEIWVSPEGTHFAKTPSDLQTFGAVQINSAFFDAHIEDTGTIRLHQDSKGRPDHLCRTVFDAGVECTPITMDANGKVFVRGESKSFVTSQQLHETCHPDVRVAYKPVSVTTGLEVAWNSVTGFPEMVFYGCFGEADVTGNFSTAFRNGTITQTLHGAYPGSILFGIELPDRAGGGSPDRHDRFEAPKTFLSNIFSPGIGFFLAGVVCTLLVFRKSLAQRQIVHVYNRVYDVDGRDTDIDGSYNSGSAFLDTSFNSNIDESFNSTTSDASYVEMSGVPNGEAREMA